LGALRLLKARKPELLHNLILFLVGDGEQQMPLKQLCQQYGLEANVRFTGYRKDSIEFVAHCDIFLLPSIANEDMPLVVLSAMEHGKTIIASRLGGIEEEIEDGVSGILIKPDLSTCEAALADAIQGQLLNPNTLLGKHARERYNLLFSASAYAQTLKLLYTRLNMKDTAI
jgi:glycosyltransferase involved in cell wall biosynthesis